MDTLLQDCVTNLDFIFTQGILAGMKPCGIILMLAELFTSESISQVYANLHEYLRKHSGVTRNIGKSHNMLPKMRDYNIKWNI